MPGRRGVGMVLVLAAFLGGCGGAEVQSAFCAYAEDVYDAAGRQSERATNALFLASARRDRTPVLLAPAGDGTPQRNPEHAAAAAEVFAIEQEIRGHLERFTAIVEDRAECFSFAERADARRLRRSLDAEA